MYSESKGPNRAKHLLLSLSSQNDSPALQIAIYNPTFHSLLHSKCIIIISTIFIIHAKRLLLVWFIIIQRGVWFGLCKALPIIFLVYLEGDTLYKLILVCFLEHFIYINNAYFKIGGKPSLPLPPHLPALYKGSLTFLQTQLWYHVSIVWSTWFS